MKLEHSADSLVSGKEHLSDKCEFSKLQNKSDDIYRCKAEGDFILGLGVKGLKKVNKILLIFLVWINIARKLPVLKNEEWEMRLL